MKRPKTRIFVQQGNKLVLVDKSVTLQQLARCIHRKKGKELVSCASCGGTIKAVVFPCTIHGKASLFSKTLPGIQPCFTCKQFKEPQP